MLWGDHMTLAIAIAVLSRAPAACRVSCDCLITSCSRLRTARTRRKQLCTGSLRE